MGSRALPVISFKLLPKLRGSSGKALSRRATSAPQQADQVPRGAREGIPSGTWRPSAGFAGMTIRVEKEAYRSAYKEIY